MTDYSLWEVILNGDSPAPTRVIKGVVQSVAPTTAEQRMDRKNELKAHGTLLMALPDKHQLKFNIHKDAKTLMEEIEKRFGGNKETKKRNKTNLEEQSLDDLFNNLKIYEAEVKSSSSASTSTQNISIISSQTTNNTNDQVSVVANVSAASVKIPVSALPSVDTLNADDLEEMDLKWQMAMLIVRARQFIQRTRRNLRANGPISMGFDMLKVECYNCHRKRYFARECRSPKDTRRNGVAEPQRRNVPVETSTSNALVLQCDGVGSYDWSFQAEEEPTNYALMALTSSSSSSSDNENLSQLFASQTNDKAILGYNTQVFTSSMFDCDEMFTSETDKSLPASPIYDRYQSRDIYHTVPPPYTRTFMPPKLDLVFHDAPNVNETNHTTFNVKLSPIKPDKDLSHTHRPSAPIIEDWVSDLEDNFEAEILETAPSFVQPTKQVKTPRSSVKTTKTSIPAANHKTAIPKPNNNGNHKNRKACFVCKSLTYLIKDCDFYEKKMAQTPVRNHEPRGNHQQYARMTLPNSQRHVVPTAVLTKSKLVSITAARPVTTAVPKPHMTRPRQAKTVVTKPYSPPRRHINRISSPKASIFPLKVIAAKAPMGNPQHALKAKGVIDSGCSRNMTGNMSYLSDFEELNGGYVTFVGNPKGGKISGKATKDETSPILKTFITGIENQLSLKVKIIRSDNGTELKNNDLNQFCGMKGIKREFSAPRTPLQNRIAKRKNKTLIEAAKTMLTDLLLPIPFWVEAVNTACYVQNRVLVTNSQNKIPYELLLGRTPSIGFMRPFGCPVTILNTLDPLGNQSNPSAGVQEQINVEKEGEENVQPYVFFPIWSFGSKNPQNIDDDAAFRGKKLEFEGEKPESKVHVFSSSSAQTNKHDDKTKREAKGKIPAVRKISTNSANTFSAVGPSNTAVSPTHGKSSYVNSSQYPDDPNMSELEDITYSDDEEDVDAEADFTNLETTITISPIPTTRVHKDHHVTQIIDDLSLATQTRSMTRVAKDQGVATLIQDAKGLGLSGFATWKMAIGHTQDEVIDYEEVFAPVARIEAIRLFLAYASFIGFMVYQMDVKSAFLYRTIKEEVYVCQPLGFKDPDYPDKVYKVVKALYRLHQAHKAWYETLANYLLENGF
uniref:Putative ribonuclease H-like domain-containing protein n=1 Tax=Tanacetum cinerariifolium TaxID=118510 RepID=A0A699GL64_TANCI|nr:putative ribonuclease H-like domain-containing protein [Tanacetum cinerariifolium]